MEDENNLQIPGWMLAAAIAVPIVFYTLLIFVAGLAVGLNHSSRSFYIQHYHASEENPYGIQEGDNPLPYGEPSKLKNLRKGSGKK